MKNLFWTPSPEEADRLSADIARMYDVRYTPQKVVALVGATEGHGWNGEWSATVAMDGTIVTVSRDTSYEVADRSFGCTGGPGGWYYNGLYDRVTRIDTWSNLEEAAADPLHGPHCPVEEIRQAAARTTEMLRASYERNVAASNAAALTAQGKSDSIVLSAQAGIVAVLDTLREALSVAGAIYSDQLLETARGAVVAAVSAKHPALLSRLGEMEVDHALWRDVVYPLLGMHALPRWALDAYEAGKKRLYSSPSKAIVKTMIREFWGPFAAEMLQSATPEDPYAGLANVSGNQLRKAGCSKCFGLWEQWRQEALIREELRIDELGFEVEVKTTPKPAVAAVTAPTPDEIKKIRSDASLLAAAVAGYVQAYPEHKAAGEAALTSLRKGVTLGKLLPAQKAVALAAAEWAAK